MQRTRRFFLQASLVALGGGKAAEIFVALPRIAEAALGIAGEDSDALLDVAGRGILQSDLGEVLETFRDARIGGLCFYYQNFWPRYQTLAAIQSLDAAAESPDQISAFAKRPHRLRVLPAIARLHSLSVFDGEQLAELQAGVVSVHATALDPSTGLANREVLEIIWQAAVAALIRNELTWAEFDPGEQLILQANAVCQRFLDEDSVLFHPAIGAWQFLLTMEMAQRERTASERLRQAQQAIRSVLEHPKAKGSYWFEWLYRQYRARSGLVAAIPQMTEVVIGQSVPNFLTQDLVDYFLRVRIQHAYIIDQLAKSGDATPYMRGGGSPLTSGSREILTNYGFKRSDWMRIRTGLDATSIYAGVPAEAVQSWDAVFDSAKSVRDRNERDVWEGAERPSVDRIVATYPFGRSDRLRASGVSVSRPDGIEFVAKVFGEARQTDDMLGALWLPSALAARRELASNLGLQEAKLQGFQGSEQLPIEIARAESESAHALWKEVLESVFLGRVSVAKKTPELADSALHGSFGKERVPEPPEALGVSGDGARGDLLDAPHSEEFRMVTQAHRPELVDAQVAETQAKGERRFAELREDLERTHRGEFVIINCDTGEYLVGVDQMRLIEGFQSRYGSPRALMRLIGADYGFLRGST